MTHRDPHLMTEAQAEAFDEAVVDQLPAQAKAIFERAAAGDALTLSMLDDDLSNDMSDKDRMHLIRVCVSVGPAVAGQMLLDHIQKAIDNQAEAAAVLAVEAKLAEAHDRYVDDQIDRLQFNRHAGAMA